MTDCRLDSECFMWNNLQRPASSLLFLMLEAGSLS